MFSENLNSRIGWLGRLLAICLHPRLFASAIAAAGDLLELAERGAAQNEVKRTRDRRSISVRILIILMERT